MPENTPTYITIVCADQGKEGEEEKDKNTAVCVREKEKRHQGASECGIDIADKSSDRKLAIAKKVVAIFLIPVAISPP